MRIRHDRRSHTRTTQKRPSRVTNYVDGEPMGDALEFNPAHVRCKSCLTEFKFNGS